MQHNNTFRVGYDFCIFLAFGFFILPLKWVLAWLVASSVHELGHYLILRLFGVRVYGLELRIGGAKMLTDAMLWYVEALSAIAGPVGALSLLLFRKHIPCIAICALIQSIFNLLPLFPLDGGRVIRCIFSRILGRTDHPK